LDGVTITVVLGTAPAVAVARQLIAQGFTYDRVVDHLNETGHRTTRGKPWTYYNLRFVMRTITVFRVGKIQRAAPLQQRQRRKTSAELAAEAGLPTVTECPTCRRVTLSGVPCERCLFDENRPLCEWGR